MSIYYVSTRPGKLVMSGLEPGTKTISELKEVIRSRRDFCRDEKSIRKQDLYGYLSSGITFYALNGEEVSGILNFDMNPSIYIYGLCVPPPSTGIGTALVNAVKTFARSNSIREINLTCYDAGVADFYIRNGFKITSESEVENDSDSDDDEEKTKYEMSYIDVNGGKRKRRVRTKKRKLRKTRTITSKR